jgi:hypothetical protein
VQLPFPTSFELPFFTTVNVLLNVPPDNSIEFEVTYTAAPNEVPLKVLIESGPVLDIVRAPLFTKPELNVAAPVTVSVYPFKLRVSVVTVILLIVRLWSS